LIRTVISRVEITSVSPFSVAADSTCAGTAITLRLGVVGIVESGETLIRMMWGAYNCSSIR
jgi:hypothetical protein